MGFRARKVPVLASILSLASLTGIADTLTGDGIKFRKLQSDFSVNNGRVNLEGGLVHGAAVGFTVQGDYELSDDSLDFEEQMKQINICALGPLRVNNACVNEGVLADGAKLAVITSQAGSAEWRSTQNKDDGGDYGHHMSRAAW